MDRLPIQAIINVLLLFAAQIVCFSSTAYAGPCINGFADGYPCNKVNLLSFVPNSVFGAEKANDIWGWTDNVSGNEYALLGLTNGTAFIDISDPQNPLYLGLLPTQTVNAFARDIKVFEDHAYIVSDEMLVSDGMDQGVQVFDLNKLADVTSPPVTFTSDAIYNETPSAHNIIINEDSGMAYVVGSSTCNGGLHAIDINNKQNPVFAGCYEDDGFIHDAQCVTYSGPDVEHQGSEICVGSNGDAITIVDMTNPASPLLLSRTTYEGSGFTHQGWFTEDQSHFLVDDEGDETMFGHNTRTYIWDLKDLDNPVLNGFHQHDTTAIDHNLYIFGNKVYQANLRSGFRILELSDLDNARLTEVAYFDTFPEDYDPLISGAWGVYPFFNSGIVIVSDIEKGLFVLQPDLIDTDNEIAVVMMIINSILLEEPDTDNDGVSDNSDAFPLDPNESIDTDGDGIGNNADTDDDNDGVADTTDNCPLVSNTNQQDIDADGTGDVCDTDNDNDGVPDSSDAFPLNANESADTDNDGIGNNSDNCPTLSNISQQDIDLDGTGNICDNDNDNDGVPDNADAFPLNANESVDTDNDGIGNNYETNHGLNPQDASDASLDKDSDGVTNLEEFLLGRDPTVDEAAVIPAINSILLDE